MYNLFIMAMNTSAVQKLSLEPLYKLLTEDIKPEALSKLLDELLCDYTAMLIRIQLSDCNNKTIHQDTGLFIFYLKLLRDVLASCQNRK